MLKDRVKEEIGLLKFWLGVTVVSFVGLIAWIVANYNKALLLFVILAYLLIVVTFVASLMLHKSINKRLDILERIE